MSDTSVKTKDAQGALTQEAETIDSTSTTKNNDTSRPSSHMTQPIATEDTNLQINMELSLRAIVSDMTETDTRVGWPEKKPKYDRMMVRSSHHHYLFFVPNLCLSPCLPPCIFPSFSILYLFYNPPAWPCVRLHSLQHGWFYDSHKRVIDMLVDRDSTRCVVELGAWLGRSCEYFTTIAPNAVIFSVDLVRRKFQTNEKKIIQKNENFICKSEKNKATKSDLIIPYFIRIRY